MFGAASGAKKLKHKSKNNKRRRSSVHSSIEYFNRDIKN